MIKAGEYEDLLVSVILNGTTCLCGEVYSDYFLFILMQEVIGKSVKQAAFLSLYAVPKR